MESIDPELLRDSASVPNSLHNVLIDLHRRPYPHIPNPPSCKKRASVALIIRVRPRYAHWPDSPTPPAVQDRTIATEQRLDDFFGQTWVQHGTPEVLFIKRTSRVGDRWTGHVALPGGKRDPEDTDDRAAAIREASEEVGVDLTTGDYIYVGNLPERVVTTSWGSVPLQPTEVASTHWVSINALLSPSLRTTEYVDMSQRLANRGGFITRLLYRAFMGRMKFSAIQLKPTESLQCNTKVNLNGSANLTGSFIQRCKTCWGNGANSNNQNRPLLLWGLTLGILADFLDMLPPHTAVQLWEYPTFTTPDLRWIISLLTYRLRKRNMLQVKSGVRTIVNNTAVDSKTAALPVVLASNTAHGHNEVGIGGLGVGRYYGSSDNDGGTYAVGIMLRGYYDRLRLAIYVFIAWRIVMGSMAGVYAWRLLKGRTGR
ncbi:NUDIX hydrolase [Aspergillus clavatus NRRL 1]|uniref:NUDIX family hydrolase, putative n=1 Tax=Aspergillus clavatus (strain ATCC 1007 / CBS 513.65 / DSM 816 / NCTC 3887 / NRRL 1 / QM 1276 / 107) TaxID=344612 RepID=A1CQT9_ASPCL|nr:NUDIX family hydrolase, putative [Aspergillus clavatus NRRL 1]EAW08010.1 NUDIX family hydrolase, putative [Aspergillus clavatus NRRL 1]